MDDVWKALDDWMRAYDLWKTVAPYEHEPMLEHTCPQCQRTRLTNQPGVCWDCRHPVDQ